MAPLKMIQLIKEKYQHDFQKINQKFLRIHNSQSYTAAHSTIIDNTLINLWEDIGIHKEVSLIAVGGYGRAELFPYSDVDILILLPNNKNYEITNKVSSFITACWDIGIKIGHSVRTLKETRFEIHKDIRTTTNLLESRLIKGPDQDFIHLTDCIKNEINQRQFYIEKLKEQSARHKKFRDTAYQLEPNVKESPGGLRDLHMVLWLAASQKKGNNFKELLLNKVISKDEFNKISFHQNRIRKRRVLLHLLAQMAEDRLIFDLQNMLAQHLGYKDTRLKKSSERVMKSYYKSVNYIILFNEIMIKKLDPLQHKNTPIKHNLALYEYDNLLEIKKTNKKYFINHIFEPFITFQEEKHITGFGPNLLGLLDSSSLLINQSIRSNKKIQDDFFKIFNGKNKVNRSIRLLNKCNILGKYIPAFGKIVAQMQHDLFHIYTVDEHTLNVIENMRRFSKAKLKHEFPECHKVFLKFDKPYLLYLAAIFHDIAKGRGGNHSEKGEIIARNFGRATNMSNNDTEFIAWLVKVHLQLSHVAQKNDLSDPLVIQNFSNFISNQYRLDALYLLTVADIRATSPHVWNQWKATLLKDLYNLASANLLNRSMTPEKLTKKRKTDASKILTKYAIDTKIVKNIWAGLGNEYFYKFDEHDIVWHTRVLVNFNQRKNTIVKARHARDGNGLEILVYSKNTDNLFLKITNFLNNNQFDVTQARILTTKKNYALDVFSVLMEENSSTSYDLIFEHINRNLTKIVEDEKSAIEPQNISKSRQASHHQFNTEISYTKLANNLFEFQIITEKQRGLLSLLANEINKNDFSIKNAKINTLGERVEDFFILESDKPSVLSNLEQLKTNIHNQIQNVGKKQLQSNPA